MTIGYIYPIMKKGEIELSKFEVEFYRKENGECPFLDFYFSMNDKLRAKTSRTIQGSDISRVFYFFMIGQKIVFTNGYIKKRQKVDKNQIELAKKYRKEYLGRKE